MNRTVLFLILFSTAGLVSANEGSGDFSPAQIQAMEERLLTIADPAARLFFQSAVERAKGSPERALKTLAQLIVKYSYDKKWVPQSELLCAELYLELGMIEAAEVTARQVQFLNKGTEIESKAQVLRQKIKQIKEQSEELN